MRIDFLTSDHGFLLIEFKDLTYKNCNFKSKMEGTLLKEALHKFVNTSDEKLLHLMYALAKEYNSENSEFTIDVLQEFERRRKKFLDGSSESYSWVDAKAIITQGQKNA